jgi:hypothetical protein
MENNIPHHVTDLCIAPEVIWVENHYYEYFEYEFSTFDDFLSFLGIEDDDN